MKNNVPKYLIIDFSRIDQDTDAGDDEVIRFSKMLLSKNREAYEVLAK